MHDRIRPLLHQCFLDRFSILQIALNKFGARIERGAMAFAQVVEDRNAVAFVEQQLGADATDIASTSGNENLHSRQNRRGAPLINPKCGLWKPLPTPVRRS